MANAVASLVISARAGSGNREPEGFAAQARGIAGRQAERLAATRR